jgi:two-component system sensor histidine kinase KdpD
VPGARVSAIPLVAQGSAVGVLVLAPRDGVADAGLFEFLESVGAQVALALARARLADEAKAAALVARTEELKASLLSAVSHDLRTPLGTLKGSATLLRDGGALEPAARGAILDGMVEEAERLERLVTSLLDMSRVQSGTIAVRREWLPLDELVGGALAAVDRALEGRVVSVEVDPDAPLVSADPVLVERVLVNVLDNAAKYTPAGSPIEVRARVEGGVAEIEIRDHGPGFPPGDEERLFEKFQRGAAGEVRGAGLGLAIARGFAEAHGGTLTLRRPSGGGAALVLHLPSAGAPPTVETRA